MSDPMSRPDPTAPAALPRYRLGTGVRLIPRGADLQIGTAVGRRYLLADAPDRALAILTGLDGTHPAHQLLTSRDDRRWWAEALQELHRAGLLQTTGRGPQLGAGPVDERVDLTHRYGADAADRALGRRADAIVEVRGAGRIAGLIAGLLSAAGIGHVHSTRTRAARASDTLLAAERPDAVASSDPGVAHGSGLRTSSVRSPAGLRPTVVVLAGDSPAEYTDARTLMTTGVPHLAVGAADGRAVVGPLVLPGRSSCLWCLDLGRADRDPEWATLRLAAATSATVPPAVLTAGAAALGCADVLHVIEGIRQPLTVDGTLEWDATSLPRRRTWRPHPRCGCTRRS